MHGIAIQFGATDNVGQPSTKNGINPGAPWKVDFNLEKFQVGCSA